MLLNCAERVAQIEELINRAKPLKPAEYLALLKETQKNFVVFLAIQSVNCETGKTGGLIHAIEKIHWLVDSVVSQWSPIVLGERMEYVC